MPAKTQISRNTQALRIQAGGVDDRRLVRLIPVGSKWRFFGKKVRVKKHWHGRLMYSDEAPQPMVWIYNYSYREAASYPLEFFAKHAVKILPNAKGMARGAPESPFK
jgi:hypothetical protein